MARLIGFQQEDGSPDGAGTFHFDDGSSTYAYSPDDAAPFAGQAPEQMPDQRLAWGGGDNADTASDVNPDMSNLEKVPRGADPQPPTEPGMLNRVPRANPPQAAEPVLERGTEGKVARGPEPEPEGHGVRQPEPTAPSSPMGMTGAAPRPQGPDPALAQFGGQAPRGMQAKDYEAKFTDAGAPNSEENKAARAEASLNDAQIRQKWVDIQHARLSAERDAAINAAQKQHEEVKRHEAKVDSIRNTYRQARESVQKEVDDAAQEKVDPDKFFKDRGPLARIGAALAQAFGAFGATLGHTANFAQQIIDGEINRDIAAQRDNIAKHGAESKTKLSRLMQDYGLDVDEASSMLKNSQQQLAEHVLRAHAAESKDIEVQKAQEEWLGKRGVDRVKEEQDAEDKAVGKRSGSIKYGRNTGGGANGVPRALRDVFDNPAQMKQAAMEYAKRETAAGREPTDEGFISQWVNVGKGKGPGGTEGEGELSMRAGIAVAKGATMRDRLIALGKERGAEWDPETQRFKEPSGVGGFVMGKVNALKNSVKQGLGLGAQHTLETQTEAAASTLLAAGNQRTQKTDEEAHGIISKSDPRTLAIAANQLLDEEDVFKKAAYKYAHKKRGSAPEEDEHE